MKKRLKQLFCFSVALSITMPINTVELFKTKKTNPVKIKSEKKRSKQRQLAVCVKEDYYSKFKKENIVVKTKTYATKSEAVRLLGKNGHYLMTKKKKAIYPVKITITNNSNKTWSFYKKSTKLKTVPRRHVLKRLHHRTKLRAFLAGFGIICGALLVFTLAVPPIPLFLFPELGIPEIICSVLAWPAVELLAPVSGAVMTVGIGTSATMVAAAPFVSAARAASMEKANYTLSELVKDMTKDKVLTIKPGETKSTFMFVRHRNYKKHIPVTLKNMENEKETVHFDISCQPI